MPATPSADHNEWFNACFAKLEADPDFLPAYQRYMLGEIERYPETEGLEFHECRDSPIEPEEEDSSTHAELLESEGKKFIGYYTISLAEGHLPLYAEAWAKELMSRGEWEYMSDEQKDFISHLAYEAIEVIRQPWTTDNPGYQDVLHACRAQGKDEEFAHHCARELQDRDWSFPRAFDATEQYWENIRKSLSNGRSETFAKAYAQAWNRFAEVEPIAFHYADCFESLITSGRDAAEADKIAYAFTHEYFDDETGEDDPDSDLVKDHALAKAEAALRFNDTNPGEAKNLREHFLHICQRRLPSDGTKSWFDEIERLARSVLAGEFQISEIPRSPRMEFLAEEDAREAAFKAAQQLPPFGKMSEKELMKYSYKSVDELDAWEAEIRFRDRCRAAGFDPTDPDEREEYEEHLREIRGSR